MREPQRANSHSQPNPRVGNLNGRRRAVVPSSIGSSQPTPRVGNLVRRRRDVVPATVGSGSGTQQNETGSSQTTLRSRQLSRRSPSPVPDENSVRSRPPKRPRRTTIQTRAFIEPETEPDGQAHLEPVRLSDDSSDEYQNPDDNDEIDSETEVDSETLDIVEGGASGRRDLPQAAGNRRTTVRISTSSGSQEVALVNQTPAARRRIIPGRPYSPPTFLSSSVGRYSSPLGPRSTTASGVRSSSPVGDPGTPRHGRIWPEIESRRNTVTGPEGAILERAMALMLRCTLFDDPLPNAVSLTSQVYIVWGKALDQISDAGNIEPSEESVKQVSSLG